MRVQVLNIDTNAIQPLTLESIANGTSVNQALQELRCNNTASGRLVTEAFLHALKSNPSLCKLGYPVTDAYFRGEIDKQLTRNNDAARKRRLEEKRRREAEGESPKVEVKPKAEPKGYPKPKAPEPEIVQQVPKEPELPPKEDEPKVEETKPEPKAEEPKVASPAEPELAEPAELAAPAEPAVPSETIVTKTEPEAAEAEAGKAEADVQPKCEDTPTEEPLEAPRKTPSITPSQEESALPGMVVTVMALPWSCFSTNDFWMFFCPFHVCSNVSPYLRHQFQCIICVPGRAIVIPGLCVHSMCAAII